MRPRRLTMHAFGPYAAEQVLDFGELPGDALFLVHGPTGSGKTSMLDAVCFALYGESSGEERDGASLRSHHAAPDCETSVAFEFDLGPRRYRVTRSPKQTRCISRAHASAIDANSSARSIVRAASSRPPRTDVGTRGRSRARVPRW